MLTAVGFAQVTFFLVIGWIIIFSFIDRICRCIETKNNSSLKSFMDFCEKLGKSKDDKSI